MSKYLALQIHKGKLNYDEVIEKFPQFQQDIDEELERLGGIIENTKEG